MQCSACPSVQMVRLVLMLGGGWAGVEGDVAASATMTRSCLVIRDKKMLYHNVF